MKPQHRATKTPGRVPARVCDLCLRPTSRQRVIREGKAKDLCPPCVAYMEKLPDRWPVPAERVLIYLAHRCHTDIYSESEITEFLYWVEHQRLRDYFLSLV